MITFNTGEINDVLIDDAVKEVFQKRSSDWVKYCCLVSSRSG